MMAALMVGAALSGVSPCLCQPGRSVDVWGTEIVPPEPSHFCGVDYWEEMRYECDGIESMQRVRCTCYLPTGNMAASGVYPYEGIVASNREHLGDIAALYTLDGEWIGYFECRDTGGAASLKNGTSIDVYRDTMDKALEWVATYGDYVLVQWIEAEG